jgi:NAD(P)-dependent dehydrogenase (short-subunit alcohol dehydrogenase family)
VLQDPKFRDRVVRSMPLGRVMQVEDIMGAVVFLLSPASVMVTGASLVIDGGSLTH